MDEKLIEMRNITKSFPGVLAVDDVSLSLNKGEVLALVGENGAGKSTLLKIISGVYKQDKGEIIMEGKKLNYHEPKDAINVGISVIYQELNSLLPISIAENIFVGNLYTKGKGLFKIVDKKRIATESTELLKSLSIECNPNIPISELSVAEKQITEIAKALSRKTKVLIMDEPTAALNEKEVQLLFEIIKKLKSTGTGIIYVSHRLDEIFQVSDRVQIMRDGRSVYVGETAAITKNEIITHMIGRKADQMYHKTDTASEDVVFEVEGLTTSHVKDISFSVKAGEVVGMFGLMGSGRTNIVNAIFGVEKIKSGTIKLNGEKIVIKHPSHAKDAGIGYIPNDRKIEGLMLEHTIKQNITITVLKSICKKFGLDTKMENTIADGWVKRLNIRTTDTDKQVKSLSGGNQQKVVMAKWLAIKPKVMILNEPTRGVDVGAKSEIYTIIEELCKQGMAVIMVSSELPEIISLSDRVVVIHEGRNVGEIEKGELLTTFNLMSKAIGE